VPLDMSVVLASHPTIVEASVMPRRTEGVFDSKGGDGTQLPPFARGMDAMNLHTRKWVKPSWGPSRMQSPAWTFSASQ
jgi:hypothetical protein